MGHRICTTVCGVHLSASVILLTPLLSTSPCRSREAWTWPVPLFFLRGCVRDQPYDARHETNAICNDMMSHPSTSSYTPSMGRSYSSILASVFAFLLSFSRTFSLIPAFHFVFLASASPLSIIIHRHRPDRVFSFYTGFTSISGRHCMSGIFQRSDTERQEYSLTATRRAHSVGFLFNVVLGNRCTHISLVEPWLANSPWRFTDLLFFFCRFSDWH
jgi:hypothetical protein